MEANVSRRGFVGGAALGTAALGMAAFAGTALADNDAAEIPETWDEEYDVVVVGGGGSGLAAACSACENGATNTIVYEKGDHLGGLWMTAGGSCTMGGGNIVQQRAGVEDTPDLWYEAEMHMCEYRAQPELVRMLCENGADTIQWMEDLGFIWGDLTAGVLGGDIDRGMEPEPNPEIYAGGSGTPNSGICWTQTWQHKLEEYGTPMLVNHRMTKVYREANGPVVGIEVETPDGVKNVKANKAVILCTGSWTNNDRMIAGWDPRLVGDDCYGDGGVPAENLLFVDTSGDGHIAANKIGAIFADMSFVSYLYILFGSRSYWGWGEDPIDWTTNDGWTLGKGVSRTTNTYQNCIIINGDGKRFLNEASANDPIESGLGSIGENPEAPFVKNFLNQPKPRNNWVIADSAIAEELNWPLDQIEDPNPRTGRMLDPACIAIADTLEDLAAQMGVDADGLAQTIADYNAASEAGEGDEFGKEAPFMPISTPPFYGLKTSVVRHTQRNGLRVNTKLQVIDGWADFDDPDASFTSIDDEPVIPHLYAAGELGDVLGWRRAMNTLGHYATCGRLAGKNAAQE